MRCATRTLELLLRLDGRHLVALDDLAWVEAHDKSTGWYDRALSETVLEAIAFGWSPSTNPMETTRWWCIECVYSDEQSVCQLLTN